MALLMMQFYSALRSSYCLHVVFRPYCNLGDIQFDIHTKQQVQLTELPKKHYYIVTHRNSLQH